MPYLPLRRYAVAQIAHKIGVDNGDGDTCQGPMMLPAICSMNMDVRASSSGVAWDEGEGGGWGGAWEATDTTTTNHPITAMRRVTTHRSSALGEHIASNGRRFSHEERAVANDLEQLSACSGSHAVVQVGVEGS